MTFPNRLRRPPSPTHSAARFLVAWLSPRFWYYSAVRLLPSKTEETDVITGDDQRDEGTDYTGSDQRTDNEILSEHDHERRCGARGLDSSTAGTRCRCLILDFHPELAKELRPRASFAAFFSLHQHQRTGG